MEEGSLKILESASEDDVCNILKEFNTKNAQTFTFPDLSLERKQSLLDCVLRKLRSRASGRCHALCLECVRILSRDKSGLDTLLTESSLHLLVCHAGLNPDPNDPNAQQTDPRVMIESQKCLCNIIFNCPVAQRICTSNGCVEGIVQRLKTYKDPDLAHDIKFFDMRILFLLTALCGDIRPRLRGDLHGLTYLIEVLDLALREAEEKQVSLNDQDVDLCCEVLKILFNLTQTVDKNNLDEEEEAHFQRLVSILHDLLVCDISAKDKTEDLHSHTVNLLVNMPADCYEELLTPLTDSPPSAAAAAVMMDNKDIEYDGKNMEAILALLDFLSLRLDRPVKSLKESVTPILHCLCECCRANRCIRKYCRLKVLPYLRDEVKRLPGEGNTLRNKLCRLLTSPIQEVKDLAADYLFVLCKESVARFVKYTGYGNAAGLLAQRGLMAGGGHRSDYSSESEDSETEEYAELEPQVNPMTCRWEQPKPDPMEGMTEEEKEYCAMELVNQIHKLQMHGVIQPSKIGDDGKPVPIGHIAEMIEGATAPTPPDSD